MQKKKKATVTPIRKRRVKGDIDTLADEFVMPSDREVASIFVYWFGPEYQASTLSTKDAKELAILLLHFENHGLSAAEVKMLRTKYKIPAESVGTKGATMPKARKSSKTSPAIAVQVSDGRCCCVHVTTKGVRYHAMWPCKKGEEPSAAKVLALFKKKPHLFGKDDSYVTGKAAPKKAAPKKAAPKKASAKKSPKKASTKKSPKKAAPKKGTKKAAAKKSAPKKSSAKKAAPKKSAAPKKATAKKAPAKKAPKKASSKKATAKTAGADLPVTLRREGTLPHFTFVATVRHGGKRYEHHYKHITTKARVMNDFLTKSKQFHAA